MLVLRLLVLCYRALHQTNANWRGNVQRHVSVAEAHATAVLQARLETDTLERHTLSADR